MFRLTANQSRPRSIPLLGLASIVIIFSALAVPQAHAKISAEKAEIGFGGTYVAGAWTPLRIVFENAPDPNNPFDKSGDFSGQVVVLVNDTDGNTLRYTRPLELPVQSRKLVELSIQVPEFASMIKYELVSNKGKKPFKGMIAPSVSSHQNGSKLRREIMITPTVLLLARPLETPSFPTWISASGGRTAINLKTVEATELPSDYKGYEAVRLLVVRGRLSGALTSDQLVAIRNWIEIGGRLAVVTPRNHAEIQRDPWLEDLLPASIDSVHEISMAWIAEGAPTAPVLMTRWGALRPDSSVYWDTPAGSAALRRRVGLGEVYALGLDPSALGTDALNGPLGDGLRVLNESMVLAPGIEDVRARHHWSTADIDPSFTSVMLLPNRLVVVALITLFVLVVGPLNFYILRKRRRLEMAWLTIPALSLAFFFAIYIYGLFSKGGDQHIASSSVLHLGSGGSRGLVLSNTIQFSPRKATYSLAPRDAGIAMPIMNYYDNPAQGFNYYNYGNPIWGQRGRGGMAGASASDPSVATVLFQSASSSALRQPVEQWRMAFYEGERPVEIEGSIEGYLTLSPPNEGSTLPQVWLTLENNTDAILANATVHIGGSERRAGSIAARSRLDTALVPGNALARDSKSIGELVTEEDDGFQNSASKQFHSLDYPFSETHRPQRRCRLVARQNVWTSGLDIQPPPEFEKICAFIEVDLPLTLEGDVKLSTKDFLRIEAYAYDAGGVTFADPYGGATNFCNLVDASLEFLLSPPELARPVQFLEGEVIIALSNPVGANLEGVNIFAFDYSTARWQEIKTKVSPGTRRTAYGNSLFEELKIAVSPNWINPIEPMVRFRVAAESKKGSQPQYGRSGLTVNSINGYLEFRGASPRPIVSPIAAEFTKSQINPFASTPDA